MLLTDAWRGYRGIDMAGYGHKWVSIRASTENAVQLLPHVHRVASLLKRWLLATHQGAVQPEQLNYYLDEFTFRFNRRDSRARGLLFYRLLDQAVRTEPHPYEFIVSGRSEPRPGSRPNHSIQWLVDAKGYPTKSRYAEVGIMPSWGLPLESAR